jgi:hypothetical protein
MPHTTRLVIPDCVHRFAQREDRSKGVFLTEVGQLEAEAKRKLEASGYEQ